MKKYVGLIGLFSLISFLIRKQFLPNPFECYGDIGFFYNIIAEPVIHLATFLLVGLIYARKFCPILGILLYLGVYSGIVCSLWLAGLAQFAWWSIILLLFVYALIGFLVYCWSLSQEDYI